MRAVRSVAGDVAVVSVDEPPGSGELLTMQATSVCGSDLLYIRAGCQKILGHELAGTRADGTAVVVEAIYGCMDCDQCRRGAYNLCPTHPQREARIVPSLGYCAHAHGREMEDAAKMLADEPEIVKTLITHRFPLEDATEAFRVAGDRSAGAIRVVIEP
jgi:threonine dehydrogenase-like Zn-dependent dehydrogenase